VGPPGPAGPKGDPGGLNGYEVVKGNNSLASGTRIDASAICPMGKKVLGGGFEAFRLLPDATKIPEAVKVNYSVPVPPGVWTVFVEFDSAPAQPGEFIALTASAVCAAG
jgi:hypothetical protein